MYVILRGLKFSLVGSLQSFRGLIFAVDGMYVRSYVHTTSTTVGSFQGIRTMQLGLDP